MKGKEFWTRVSALILCAGMILPGAMSVNAAQGQATESTIALAETSQGYELIIEDGVVTGYKGTPVDVVIPKGVTEIGGSAFDSCDTLKTVVLPDGLKKIGNYAFAFTGNLISMNIPSSVEEVGYRAFLGSSWLEAQEKNNSMIILNHSLVHVDNDVKGKLVIPNGVKEISGGAFSLGYPELTSLEIPESVTKIGEYAFTAYSLADIKIPSSVTDFGRGAFENTPWYKAKEEEESSCNS